MAITKLYPPTLAGTIPPFCGTSLEVPFSMNRTVSLSQVGSMYLRLKDANTDTEYGIFDTAQIADWTSTALNSNNNVFGTTITSDMCVATFDLSPIRSRLIVGNYYKIQLAYQDNENGIVGYYSTIAIVKYTVKPQVYIAGLNPSVSNTNTTAYNGIYRNVNDSSEKCHQYKFEVFDDTKNNVLITTDWKYHNSNKDISSTESNDTYNFVYNIKSSEVAYIRYTVRTNNGAIYSSPDYPIVSSAQIATSITAHLSAELDYDNGCISVFLEPDQAAILQSTFIGSENKTSYVGKFVISRASSIDNYTVWLPLYSFELTGNLPTDVIFRDFTGVQGETYQYCLQQFNKYGIYSERICTDIITCHFEDAYLFDGKRQLRIRFNPKVSSFKTVLQETKKTTLGAQYPFFFRSGNVEYKEFPISGLISYMMDDNQFFLSKEQDLGMPDYWLDSFDITDNNLTYERKFRLAVLDWLNDGSIKLFRSPAEGNYMVRLMNTSLSPNDSVSRMIATFSTTAVEALSYTTDALQEYGFLNVDLSIPLVLQFYTIDLYNLTHNLGEDQLAKLTGIDLLQGFSCQYLKIEGVPPSLGKYNTVAKQTINNPSGLTPDAEEEGMYGNGYFSMGSANRYHGKKFNIGITGQYETTFDPPVKYLYLLNPHANMQGTITVGVLAQNTTWFDSVADLTTVDLFDFQEFIGVNWMNLYQKDYPVSQSSQAFYNSKDQIIKIYLAQFELAHQVYHVESLETLAQLYDLYLTPSNVSYNLLPDTLYRNEFGPIPSGQSHHTAIKPYTIYEVQFNNRDDFSWTDAQGNIHYYDNTAIYDEVSGAARAKNAKDLFVPGALFVTEHYVHEVVIPDPEDPNNHEKDTITTVDDGVTVWQYKEYSSENSAAVVQKYFIEIPKKTILDELGNELNLSATQIYIDGTLYDIAETGFLRIENMDKIPYIIQWGAQVTGTFFFRLATVSYAVEDESNLIEDNGETGKKLKRLFLLYDYGRRYLTASKLLLRRRVIGTSAVGKPTNKVTIIDNDGNEKYFVYQWNNGAFVKLDPTYYEELTNGEYWITVPQSEYNSYISSEKITYNQTLFALGENEEYTANNLMNNFVTNRRKFFNALNEELEARAISYEDEITEG